MTRPRRTRVITTASAVLALALGVAGSAGLRPALAQGRTWTTQVTLSDLRSLTCVGTSACWAVGSNSGAPVVYHTTNGGQTWIIQTVGYAVGYLQSVYCLSDGLHCWAVGTAEVGTGAAAVIFSTADGGNTWPGILVTTEAGRLNSIVCLGSEPSVNCIAVGSYNASSESTTGKILLVPGDLSSPPTSITPPTGVAALTSVTCQGSSDCLATGLTSSSPTSTDVTGTLIATASGGESWTTTSIPSDVTGLADLTCPSSGNCAAVGYTAPSGGAPQALVIDGSVTAASWTDEAHLSGVDYVDGIACPATHTCLAVGYTGIGADASAKLAWTTDGTSWDTQDAGAGYLDGVTCPTTGTCWAAGYQALGGTGSGHIDSLTTSGSSWTVQSQLSLAPRVGLTGVSCADQTDCVAVGNSASGLVILATTDGATWHNETFPATPGVLYHLDAIACPGKLDCVAVGYEVSIGSSSMTKTAISAYIMDGTNWSLPTVVSGVSHFDAVTCTSKARCLASGTDITSLATGGFTGVIDTAISLGGPWTSTTVPATVGYVTAVACAPASSTCAAVGGTQAGVPLILTTTTGSSWTIQSLPSLPSGGDYSDLNAVSCPTTTSCTAVGDQLVSVGGTAQGQAVILSGSGNGLTTWSPQAAPGNTGALRGVSCATAQTCEAVGTTISSDIAPHEPVGPATTALSTSNGSGWTADTLPADAPLLRAVACVAGTSACWAVGTGSIVAAGS